MHYGNSTDEILRHMSYSSTSRTPSLSTTLTLYFSGLTTRRFDTSSMQRFRVARPSSRVASGSWYLKEKVLSASPHEGEC